MLAAGRADERLRLIGEIEQPPREADRDHAVRVAVTGKTVSPGLFEVLTLVGRPRVTARLAAARRLSL